MPLTNCETNLKLKWSAKCFLVTGTVTNHEPKYTITDTKFYVVIATSPTQR